MTRAEKNAANVASEYSGMIATSPAMIRVDTR
jgi:hypothetical protein